MTRSADSSSCASLIARSGRMARMSYHDGMAQPPLMVTARVGAWGSTKRVVPSTSCRSSATGRKS
ncbi:hypothetical protein D9M73_211430 [compost metagenome]